MSNRYESAKKIFAGYGIDTDAAIARLKDIPVSLHCWQGDDVIGFDHDGPLTGGIQTTGNYPGKARNPKELMADIEKVIALCPGKIKLNVHACYAIFKKVRSKTKFWQMIGRGNSGSSTAKPASASPAILRKRPAFPA